MKNASRFIAILSICLIFVFTSKGFAVELAKPNSSPVLVNGNKVEFEAYTINENNYFKLRDIAQVLKDTNSKFEVSWDGEKNAINIIIGEKYTSSDANSISKTLETKDANLSNSKILMNNEEIKLTAYTIGENNYFKLRDLGNAIGFEVGWDQVSSTITIETDKDNDSSVEKVEEKDKNEAYDIFVKEIKNYVGKWGFILEYKDDQGKLIDKDMVVIDIDKNGGFNYYLQRESTKVKSENLKGTVKGIMIDGKVVFVLIGESGSFLDVPVTKDQIYSGLSIIEKDSLKYLQMDIIPSNTSFTFVKYSE